MFLSDFRQRELSFYYEITICTWTRGERNCAGESTLLY